MCPDSCRPPRKKYDTLLHISIFRHNFCSCPVRLVLSYCIQTSFKTHLIPRHTSSQHPSSSTCSTHNPHSMPPPLLQCHQGSAKMPSRPQVQKSGTCTSYVLLFLLLLLLPVCLPTCTHPPTFASPNAAFATSAPSVGSAKSPHGCLCHLTPIHSQIVMRLVLRRLVVKDGLVWSRRVLVRWSGCDAWRRRRSTIVILVGGHLHFFSFLFFSLLGVGLVKRWPFLYLQGTRYVLIYWLEVRITSVPTYRRHDGAGSARSRTTGEKEEKEA